MEIKLNLIEARKIQDSELKRMFHSSDIEVDYPDGSFIKSDIKELQVEPNDLPIAVRFVNLYTTARDVNSVHVTSRNAFPLKAENLAYNCFHDFILLDDPKNYKVRASFSPWQLLVLDHESVKVGSVTSYCDYVFRRFYFHIFSPLVNRKVDKLQSTCLLISHREKLKQSSEILENVGVNKYHGAIMVLLSYTKLMDMVNSEVVKWIVLNYPKYREMIEACEQELLFDLQTSARLTSFHLG